MDDPACASLDGTCAVPAQELNEQTYIYWRDYILPSTADLRWQEIPWRAAFWPAVVEAQQRQKPILLFAMNGHPLGCT